MEAYQFFNFLRKVKYRGELKDIIKNPNKYKEYFASEEHFSRFFNAIKNIKYKKVTENYILIYYNNDIYNLAILIYDPKLDKIYCDLFLVDERTYERINKDTDVLEILYRIDVEREIRVDGDLYIQIIYRGILWRYASYKEFSYIGSNLNMLFIDVIKFFESLLNVIIYKDRESYRFPYFSIFDFKNITIDLDYLIKSIKKLSLSQEEKEDIIEKLFRLKDKLKNNYLKLKEIKIPLVDFRIWKKSKLVDEMLYYIYKMNHLFLRYYPIQIDYIKLQQKLYSLSTAELEIFKKIFKSMYDFVNALYSFSKKILEETYLYSSIMNRYLEELKSKAKLYKLNLKERGSKNVHTLVFIGYEDGNNYIALTDIVVKHPEHGTKVIIVNGYNPLYIKNILDKKPTTMMKVPIMVFRPFLA